MKLTGRILTSAIALSMVFQTMPVCIGYADSYESFEQDNNFEWRVNSITNDIKFYVECFKDEVEIPSELNGKPVTELDLNFVLSINSSFAPITLKLPESVKTVNKEWYKGNTNINKIRLVYASGETELLEGKDVFWYNNNYTDFSVMNEGDDCYVGIGTSNFNEVTIPEEIYGNKNVKIDLEHIYFSSDSNRGSCMETAFVVNVPKGAEIVNKHWKSAVTGIPVIRLVYESGETEELKSDDYEEMLEYAKNSEEASGFFDMINEYPLLLSSILILHPDHKDTGYMFEEKDRLEQMRQIYKYTYSGSPIYSYDFLYMYNSPSDVDLQDLIMTSRGVYNYTITDYSNNNLMYLGADYVLREDEKVVNEHWLAAENGLLDIRLLYPSGEEKYLRADDYDKYMPGSSYFDKCNVIVMNNLRIDFDNYPDNISTIALKTEDFLKWTDYSSINDITYKYSAFENIEFEEFVFPDNKGNIYLDGTPFSDSKIKKLIIPGNLINLKAEYFTYSNIDKIVFQEDVDIEDGLFSENANIKEVTFEKSADIGRVAFWNCSELSNVDIDLSEKINGSAFDNCNKLMNISGEPPVNEDGSLKQEYENFVRKNFNDAMSIGFLDKYVSYRVKQAVSEAVTDDMPDIVKVKALHDKLCSITTYDTDNVDDVKNHVDVSVFLNDSTVCDGYARTMNLMLHEAGIESCFVNTEDHAWVIVKLGDHYFHVDPTWDDGDTVKYDWFMKSDSQIDGKDFHSNWELKCPSSMHSFQWETMPECTDIMGDIDDNDIIDGRDASAILTSYAKASVGGKEEVDSILADFNYDGIVDGRDASAVLTYYAKSSVDN